MQLDEKMTNMEASYAPKTKNFRGILSHKVRVGIAAVVMVIGYSRFWTRVFDKLDLEMDAIFASLLITRDKKKTKRRRKRELRKESWRERKITMINKIKAIKNKCTMQKQGTHTAPALLLQQQRRL